MNKKKIITNKEGSPILWSLYDLRSYWGPRVKSSNKGEFQAIIDAFVRHCTSRELSPAGLIRVVKLLSTADYAGITRSIKHYERRVQNTGKTLMSHLGIDSELSSYTPGEVDEALLQEMFPQAFDEKFDRSWAKNWFETKGRYIGTGSSRLPRTDESEQSIWQITQRDAIRKGRMPYWRMVLLEMFDDWDWSPASADSVNERRKQVLLASVERGEYKPGSRIPTTKIPNSVRMIIKRIRKEKRTGTMAKIWVQEFSMLGVFVTG